MHEWAELEWIHPQVVYLMMVARYTTVSLHRGLRSENCATPIEILYMHRGKSLHVCWQHM